MARLERDHLRTRRLFFIRNLHKRPLLPGRLNWPPVAMLGTVLGIFARGDEIVRGGAAIKTNTT